MGKLICPRCYNDLIHEWTDSEGNHYFYCDKPHTLFQKFLDLIRLWEVYYRRFIQ